jgi:hypothetical protein
MPRFQEIKSLNEISLSPQWADSTKFKSKGNVVDRYGHDVNSHFQGHTYQLIAKKERPLTFRETLLRKIKGTLFVVFTLGAALYSSSVRKLFTRKVAVIHFGVALMSSPQPATPPFQPTETSVTLPKSNTASEKKSTLEIPEGPITSGYGEYIVFHQRKRGGSRRKISEETFLKVYGIFQEFSISKILESPCPAGEVTAKFANRYKLMRKKVKKLDPSLEIAFVPKVLYELVYICKGIKEDLTARTSCPFLSWDKEVKSRTMRDKKKCWHIWSDETRDRSIFRLNKALTKLLNPSKQGLSYQELLTHVNKKIDFLKSSADFVREKWAVWHKEYSEISRIMPSQKNGQRNLPEDVIKYAKEKERKDISVFWLWQSPTCAFVCHTEERHPKGTARSLGISSESDKQIIRNALAVECSKKAATGCVFYRGSNFSDDNVFYEKNHDKPHSLSYGCSLFSGFATDVGATAFAHMRKDQDAYAINVPLEEIKVSPFYPGEQTSFDQMLGCGEMFHARTKLWKGSSTDSYISGVKGASDDRDRRSLVSELSKPELLSLFQRYKSAAVFLK